LADAARHSKAGRERSIMKPEVFRRTIAALTLLASSTLSFGATPPKLNVGDAAPKLQTGKWIQGEPVKEFQKGKAYIVEFWATWCGPCKFAIPHLNEIHSRFKDKGLVVIGQDCSEQDESQVAPFVKKMGTNMSYRVVLDDKQGAEGGKMAQTWMEAAGREGIPCAFLIDTAGLIAWIGHPLQLNDNLIQDVLAGKFDVKKAAADYVKEREDREKLQIVGNELNRAMMNKDWDLATTKLAEAEKIAPSPNFEMARFYILIGKKDYAAAYKSAREFSNTHKDDAMVQNALAWQIVSNKAIEKPDLELADLLATRANDASQGKDAGILDTVARVAFMRNNKEKAIDFQQKAVALADEEVKDRLQKTLDSYKKGQLPEIE
jgi:thiol-disulfide isomerase/thioredoxin